MAANFSPTVAGVRPGQQAAESDETTFSLSDPLGRGALLTLVAVVGGVTFAYWRMLDHTAKVWDQPQYSHGWIIPLIALYVIWARRPNPSAQAPMTIDLGIIQTNVPTIVGAVLSIGAAVAGLVSGATWLAGVGLALFLVVALGTLMFGQPLTPLKNSWRFDLGDPAEKVLLGFAVVASVLVAIVGAGLAPQNLMMPLLLLTVVLYGGSLLGVALSTTIGLSRRTGSESLAAVVAIIGTSVTWSQASQFDMMPLARLCFLTTLIGVFALVGGLRLLHWAGPGLAFLIFMFPLPSKLETTVLPALQKIATIMSTFVLQLLGVSVFREGSSLHVEGVTDPLFVAEACSGLRMVTIFGAMTLAMVFLIRRPWWDKFIVLLSALPVALITNVLRIVVTALLYKAFPDDKNLHQSVHDYAGLAMMPVAMGILWLELSILSSLTVEEEEAYAGPASAGGPLPRG